MDVTSFQKKRKTGSGRLLKYYPSSYAGANGGPTWILVVYHIVCLEWCKRFTGSFHGISVTEVCIESGVATKRDKFE